MSDDPFSRVYWSIRSDTKFEGIYSDDHHLATWLRLLIAADAVWPAPADIPRAARPSSIRALAEAGLIDLMPGHLVRIHGLDAEKRRRSAQASAAAITRWNAQSIADSNANSIPESNASRARGEARVEIASSSDSNSSNAIPTPTPPEWEEAWYLTGRRRAPSEAQRRIIDEALAWWDETGSNRIASLFLSHPDNPIGALIDAKTAYKAERMESVRAGEAESRQRAAESKASRYGLSGVNAEIARMLQEREEAAV